MASPPGLATLSGLLHDSEAHGPVGGHVVVHPQRHRLQQTFCSNKQPLLKDTLGPGQTRPDAAKSGMVRCLQTQRALQLTWQRDSSWQSDPLLGWPSIICNVDTAGKGTWCLCDRRPSQSIAKSPQMGS